MIIVSCYFFQITTTNFARTILLLIVTVNNIARIIWEIKDEIYPATTGCMGKNLGEGGNI